jgi:predicted TIM-barrel fold metal-dependent hydrolase
MRPTATSSTSDLQLPRDTLPVTPSDIDRREFLVSAASGAAASLARPARAGAADVPALVIDCHAHIYSADEGTYPTIEKPYRPPAGKGSVAHLRREMMASGVTQVTTIQTTTFYQFDNRFLADSANRNRDIMVGVCTLDPDNPSSPELLTKYVRQSNVRGVRSITAKGGRLDDPGVDRLWAAAERLGIVVNVLAGRDKADEIEALARRHPSLRVVIDHCSASRPARSSNPRSRPSSDSPACRGSMPS